MQRYLILGGAAVLVLGAGLVHGLWTERWGSSDELPRAVARLETVPLRLDAWEGRDRPIEDATIERAELAGYLNRPYTHRESRQTVLLLLLCGRFGPISVHTPDVCYGGSGYVMFGSASRFELSYAPDRPPAEFWTARFYKPASTEAAPLRIFWSWNAGGSWLAPEYPRLTFRRSPVLFKLYAVREMTSLADPLDTDPALDFLRAFLPRFEPGAARAERLYEQVYVLNSDCSDSETTAGREFLAGHNSRRTKKRRRCLDARTGRKTVSKV